MDKTVKSHRCEMCRKIFLSEYALYRHKFMHAKRIVSKCSEHIPKREGEACRAFQNKKALQQHMNSRKHICDCCSRTFASKSSLKRHQAKSAPLHKCNTCGKTFVNKASLASHCHPTKNNSLHMCDKCGRSFRDLKRHYVTHSELRPHLCNVCGKGFRSKTILREHSLVHSVEQHSCVICNRGFKNKKSLRRHYLTHTGEKPHVCEVCGRGFSVKSSLNKHVLSHEKGITSKKTIHQH